MGKKKNANGLGRSVIRDRFGKKNKPGSDTFLHTSELNDGYDWGRLNLQSVTEQNNLEDFLSTAEMAGTEFTAEKLNIKFISKSTYTGLPHGEELQTINNLHKQHEKLLRIPRRPHWTTEMSASELDTNEKTAFLEWRRTLALLQEKEGMVMTPYEKNLDFWRQLWRVIERSDIVVQIVDARNPLLFYCSDLEAYVGEIDPSKKCVLLINKADYLTLQQRESWANHFTKQGVRVAFWSAIDEVNRQETEEMVEEAEGDREWKARSVNNDSDEDDQMPAEQDSDIFESGKDEGNNDNHANHIDLSTSDSTADGSSCGDKITESAMDNERDTGVNVTDKENSDQTVAQGSNVHTDDDSNMLVDESTNLHAVEKVAESSSAIEEGCAKCSVALQLRNTSHIHTGPELLDFFRDLHTDKKVHEGLTTVGMVGYPNVGKSSTINAILKMKKVPVSATPGRTKHFQTLYVDKTMMLCDCPGLVFPSFVTTKAELIVNGVLPIDQMRDHVPPTSLICERIPRHVLASTYGIVLPQPQEGEDPDRYPTAEELLNAYGAMRGYMTARGVPDCPRASRYILKDYVNGKLLYCHPPTGEDPLTFNHYTIDEQSETVTCEAGSEQPMATNVPSTSNIDKEFFSKTYSTVHSRTARSGGIDSGNSQTGAGSQTSLTEKPWKKHNNRNKKEKMRRVYGHLDKH